MAIARSQQVTEFLTFNENSQEAQQELEQQRADAKVDKDYGPRGGTAAEGDLDAHDRKSDSAQAGRPRKRRNSAEDSGAGHAANDENGENGENGEIGPLSQRFRLLPAGTHVAVAAHAHSLFAQAVDAEQSARDGSAARSLHVDPDADTDDEKGPLSSRSTSSSSADSSGSSSEGSMSSEVKRGEGSSDVGVGHESKETQSQSQQLSPRFPADIRSPALLPEDSQMSPLLVEFEPQRLRGLSRSPERLRLPSPRPAEPPRLPPSLSLSERDHDSSDRKHGQRLLTLCAV